MVWCGYEGRGGKFMTLVLFLRCSATDGIIFRSKEKIERVTTSKMTLMSITILKHINPTTSYLIQRSPTTPQHIFPHLKQLLVMVMVFYRPHDTDAPHHTTPPHPTPPHHNSTPQTTPCYGQSSPARHHHTTTPPHHTSNNSLLWSIIARTTLVQSLLSSAMAAREAGDTLSAPAR